MSSCRFALPLLRALIGWTALTGASAQAQSLITLYQSARDYDATYQAARAQYDANLARAEQARAGLLPAIGLSAGVMRSHLDIDTAKGETQRGFQTQSTGINATQPLYRPANFATYEQGKVQVDIARAVLDAAEQDLIVRVSQAYFDVLASQDSLALVRAQKAAINEQLAFAKRNFEVGTTTITDSREAQARADLVEAQELAAENDLQIKKIALDVLVGRPGSAPAPLRVPVQLPVLAPRDMGVWVGMAQQVHPSIRQARDALDVATLEVQKAEAGHKPTLDATLGYNITNNPNGTAASVAQQRVHAATIGINFNLPLFAGFAVQNRIKETLALEEQSRAVLESTLRNVTQATRQSYLSLLSSAAQVRALEAAEASSQSALDANRLGYQVGVRINIDVLNSQSQLFQTKRDLAVARYNVLIGNLRLRQANGTLEPDDLQAINAVLAPPGTGDASPTSAPGATTTAPISQRSSLTVPYAPITPPPSIDRVLPPANVPAVTPTPFNPLPPVMPVPPPPPVFIPPPR